MALASASCKTVSRGGGRSATAAAAYRTSEMITDLRTGEVHDYRRRSGVDHVSMHLPEGAPTMTTAELWNKAEAVELRKNSTVARELVVALPHELKKEQRRELSARIAAQLVQRYQVAAQVAVHLPSSDGDKRNHHAHIMFTTRVMDSCGELGAKTRQLDDLKTGPVEVLWMRGMVEVETNAALEHAGSAERINMRSLKLQQVEAAALMDVGPLPNHLKVVARIVELDRVPTGHEGPRATQIRRECAAKNRAPLGVIDVLAMNDERYSLQDLKSEKAALDAEIYAEERLAIDYSAALVIDAAFEIDRARELQELLDSEQGEQQADLVCIAAEQAVAKAAAELEQLYGEALVEDIERELDDFVLVEQKLTYAKISDIEREQAHSAALVDDVAFEIDLGRELAVLIDGELTAHAAALGVCVSEQAASRAQAVADKREARQLMQWARDVTAQLSSHLELCSPQRRAAMAEDADVFERMATLLRELSANVVPELKVMKAVENKVNDFMRIFKSTPEPELLILFNFEISPAAPGNSRPGEVLWPHIPHSIDLESRAVTYYEDAARTTPFAVDGYDKISVVDGKPKSVEMALKMAIISFGNDLKVTGPAEFKVEILEIVVRLDLAVTFSDPLMNVELARMRAPAQLPEIDQADVRAERLVEADDVEPQWYEYQFDGEVYRRDAEYAEDASRVQWCNADSNDGVWHDQPQETVDQHAGHEQEQDYSDGPGM